MERHGWRLLFYTELSKELANLENAAERARRKDPEGFRSNANVKLLQAVDRAMSEIIPQDPSRAEYRQGNAPGRGYRHWRRAKIGRRFRLFFRYDAKAKVIVYAWMNDQHQMAPVGGRHMDVDHLQSGELLDDGAWGEAGRLGPGEVLQGHEQAIGDERDEDVRLDARFELVEDGSDSIVRKDGSCAMRS